MPVYGMPTALESSLNTLLQQRQPSSWRVSGHSDDITVVLRWTKTDWVYAKDNHWTTTPNHISKASALSYASSFDEAPNSNNNNNNSNNNNNNKYQEQKSSTTASHNANCSKKHKRKHSSSSSSSSCPGKDPHHVSTTSRSRHNSNSVSKRDKGSKSVIQSYATPPHAHQEADPYPVFVTSAESLNRTTSGHGFIQDDNNVNNKVNHDKEINNYRIENKDGKEHVIKISKVYTDRYLADAQYHYHHHQQHQQKHQQQHPDLYTRSSSTLTNSTHANNHYTNSFKADGKSGHKGSNSSSNKDSSASIDGRRHAPQSPSYFYNAVAQGLQKEPTSPVLGSDKVQRGNASSSSSSSSSRSARIHRQASFDNGGGTLLEREAASSFQSDDDEELDMICSAGTAELSLEVDDHDMKG